MESFSVQFPEKLIEKMDDIVSKKQYASRAEFIRDCVRRTIGEK
jgi:metal-responsive CopG/Arc/MetJ family transcriptional regulator